MSEDNSDEGLPDKIKIPLILLNVLIIIVGGFLFFLIIKSKSFKKYNWLYNIIFCFVIFVDSILRVIDFNNGDNCNTYEKIGAFFLVFFDKLILVTLSMQSFIIYFGLINKDIYKKREKSIFFITFSFGLIVSIILTSIYLSKGFTSYSMYCYCEGTNLKKALDCIFNAIFLLICLLCYIRILIYLIRKRNKAQDGTFEFLSYHHYFNIMLIKLIINTFTFIESYLIIYDKLPDDYVDLIYVSTIFLVDINITLNEEVIKETKKIFCSKNSDSKKIALVNDNTRLDGDIEDDGDSERSGSTELKRQGTDF